jgi:hypothetical protein
MRLATSIGSERIMYPDESGAFRPRFMSVSITAFSLRLRSVFQDSRVSQAQGKNHTGQGHER